MSVFIKSGVTFVAPPTHAAEPLIHSEWLDLSRKWDGGRKEEEQGASEMERDGFRIHALLGAHSKIKKKRRLAEWGQAAGKRRETEELL